MKRHKIPLRGRNLTIGISCFIILKITVPTALNKNRYIKDKNKQKNAKFTSMLYEKLYLININKTIRNYKLA